MPIGGSGSVVANAAARKRQLANVRKNLLDRPGTVRRGGPPPPTAPAQDRTSPREQAMARSQELRPIAAEEGQQRPAQPQDADQKAPGLFDEATRARLLEQAQPFLAEMKMEKMAQLHKKIGRARRFWGGGV